MPRLKSPRLKRKQLKAKTCRSAGKSWNSSNASFAFSKPSLKRWPRSLRTNRQRVKAGLRLRPPHDRGSRRQTEMNDALTRSVADAERMVVNCKWAAPSVSGSSSRLPAGFNQRPLSLVDGPRTDAAPAAVGCGLGVRSFPAHIQGCRCASDVGRRGDATRVALVRELSPSSIRCWTSLADPNDFQTYWQLMFSTIASSEITGRGMWWDRKGTRGEDGLGTSILHIPTAWIIKGSPLQDSGPSGRRIARTNSQSPATRLSNFHYPDPDGTHPNDVISPLAKISEAASLTSKSRRLNTRASKMAFIR